MTPIRIILDGEAAWPDLDHKLRDGSARWIRSGVDGSLAIAALTGGMDSGRLSIAIRVDDANGQAVIIETSWRLLRLACDAISARYGSGGD